ncbi:Band 4.1-like protein 2 [Echinococcus granulosus]|uniref:FERM domain containing protein 5 n=1 Tax=Echinococcus granulosus TaxID=6210 RepID=A0A068WJ30_ECHGR|nr:Band 4.1-like protein 2 [Echinococcus granulosus]CDS17619.1 FERM domain containing protein 5 [Echinococcus granulosus]
MTAASPTEINLDTSPDVHKKGQFRKGSLFTLFNLASNERINETTDVDIQLFDGTKMRAFIDHKITGKILVNHIATELGDATKAKYLGLIIEQPGEFPEWMDLNNSVAKEKAAKGFDIIMVRIKFYPSDPVSEMSSDFFANLLYYQLRHDLAVGRLLGKERDRCLLVAYSVQYEGGLGDIPRDKLLQYDIVRSKVSSHRLDNSMQNQIKEYLQENYDISPHDALTAFLRVATRMDTYGIEPFDAKDQRGNGIAVGFNFKGLSVFKSSQQVNFFRWESMLSYECEKKTVVITIKTRDVKKKIGFKCDSRANAMQLYRRLREASRFYRSGNMDYRSDSEKSHKIGSPNFSKSTDSEASDFSVNSSQTCQIKRISSFSRPQRFFTLSPPRASRKMIQLQVSSTEAVTPTNKPNFPLNCSPDVPTILLHPPDPDEGPNTPTFDPDVSITKPVGGAVTSLPKAVQPVISKCTAEEETVNLHEEEPEFLNENNDEKEEGRKRDPTKVGQEGGGDRDIDKGEEMEEGNDKKNEDRIGDQCKENAINVKGKAEEEEEEGNELLPAEVSYTPNSNSQESLLNVASPFGDAAKMSFFTNLESKRLGLGILDLKLSNSMTSITIPPTGSVSSASQSPLHFFPKRRGRNAQPI